MACGKMFVVLCFFTCIVLTECGRLQYFGVSTSRDGGSEIISEPFMSNRKRFDESLADFQRLGGDASVTALQRKSIIKGQLVSSSEAAWNAMSPKLRCGDNLMKLQLCGPEVAQLELCRDNGAPVPLTKLPPHCGSTIPTYEGLVYTTPYDGCGVMQQGGSYVMQIQWQGNSVIISCPISTTANEALLGPNPPSYQQILLPPSLPDAPSLTADTMQEPFTSETGETSIPTSQEMLKPQPPGSHQEFLQRLLPYYYPRYHYPGKIYPPEQPDLTSLPPDASVAQAPIQDSNPQLPGYPLVFWPYYDHSHHGNSKPPEKPGLVVSLPTDTSVAQDPNQNPQLPGYPQVFRPYYSPSKPKSPEKPELTSLPIDTPVAQAPIQDSNPQFPGYPQVFRPYYSPSKPKSPEKPDLTSLPIDTPVAQAPIQDSNPQLPGYPQVFWPYFYPQYHPVRPKPSKKPAPAIPIKFASSNPEAATPFLPWRCVPSA